MTSDYAQKQLKELREQLAAAKKKPSPQLTPEIMAQRIQSLIIQILHAIATDGDVRSRRLAAVVLEAIQLH